jgi:hypothetical protein
MNEQMNIEGDGKEQKVLVDDVEFTSEDGWIKYRLVYSNGSKSQPIDADFQTNNPNAQTKFKFIKEKNVGKPKEE